MPAKEKNDLVDDDADEKLGAEKELPDAEDTDESGDNADTDADAEGDGGEPAPRRSALEILRSIIGSPKTKHEGYYQVKVSDEHIGEAHDAIAAAKDADDE